MDLIDSHLNDSDKETSEKPGIHSREKFQKIMKNCEKRNKKRAANSHILETRQDYIREDLEAKTKIPRISKSTEQFKPGYSSNPDEIKNSLDRSWVFAINARQNPNSDTFLFD